MPPKKNTSDPKGGDAGSGEGAWKWTPENDRTLFLLMMGRGALGKDDYEQMAAGLSAKTNWNAVRQRVGKLRREQKKKYDDLGWEVPGTPSKGKVAPATQKKRKGSDDEDGDDTPETPSKAKKPRAKKVPKSKEDVQDDDEEGGDVKHKGVKQEEVDEAV